VGRERKGRSDGEVMQGGGRYLGVNWVHECLSGGEEGEGVKVKNEGGRMGQGERGSDR